LTGASAGSFSGDVTASSSPAANKTVAVSGTTSAAGGVYEAGAVGVFAEGENPLFDDVLHGADLAISGGGGQS
jgi:hypothetical protein